MLNVLMGRANTGKSRAVLQRIAALGDTGRQILLVPEHASYRAERDVCRICGNTASRHAEVLSFRRLSQRVLQSVGQEAVTLDNGGRILTLQRALMETAPLLRIYRRPARRAGALEQMLSLFDELRCYDVSPEQLSQKALALEGDSRDKLTDLSVIYAAYEARLCRPGLDRRDLMSKLCDCIGASACCRDKDIFIDGFTYFTAQERRVLLALLRQSRSLTVTLLGEPESAEEVFAPSRRTLQRLTDLACQAGVPLKIETLKNADPSPLGHLERHFFGTARPYEGDAGALCLREASTAYDEVEQAAADIRRLLQGGRCRCRDITVAVADLEQYRQTIETVFRRYDVPVYLSRRTAVTEKPAVTLLTAVLGSVAGGYEYEEMFTWLKTGLGGLSIEECDVLENYVLKWGIRGRAWVQEEDWQEHPAGYGVPWDEAGRRQLAAVNALRRRIQAPLGALAAGLKAAANGKEVVEALYGFMEQLDLEAALTDQMERQRRQGLLQEAEETAQLWEILCRVLEQFAEVLGDEPMAGEDLEGLFRLVLTQYSVGTIPAALDQVCVSEIARNDRHTVKYLFLLGANDHVLPAVGQTGGLLNRDDRRSLALQGVELAPTGVERLGIELQNIYAALAQPTCGLTVSCPMAEVSGAALRPSFLFRRIETLFPALRRQKEPYDKAYRLTAPLPALEAAGRCMDGALWRCVAALPGREETRRAMERARQGERGRLSPAGVEALYGRELRLSASRLERLSSCHFAYFMEYGLRAKIREAAAFDAPQIGTLLHYLLENVTREVLADGGFAQAQPERLQGLTRQYMDRYAREILGGLERRSRRFCYLFQRLETTAQAVVERLAAELSQSRFVPLQFELAFGGGGEHALPEMRLDTAAGTLHLRGKVDRVDGWMKDGRMYLRVVDYKSGKKRFDLADLQMGLALQLPLYLFALHRQGRALFHADTEMAGILYLPARDDLLTASRAITDEELERERSRQLRPSGLLLAEPEVLEAMEQTALSRPRFLPVRVDRWGELSGDLASARQLRQLERFVEGLLGDIAQELRRGNIDADPCARSEEDTQCRFCKWVSACHFQEGRGRDRLRRILPVKPEEFWNKLEKGGEGPCRP